MTFDALIDMLEMGIGRNFEPELEKQYRTKRVPWVEEMGKKLGDASIRPGINYQVRVIPEDRVNAFAYPGGYIYIYEGILKQFPQDVVAGVVAHEVAHIANRHCLAALAQTYGMDQLVVNMGDNKQIFQLANNLIHAGYSRDMELYADKCAVDYNQKAGLYPLGIKHFMEWLEPQEQQLGMVEKYFAHHPPASDRLTNINNEIRRLGISEEEEPVVPGPPIQWSKYLPWVLIPAGLVGVVALARRK